MNWDVIGALARQEVRMRLRRTSTLVALLVAVALAWAMIPDPASGVALMVSGSARVFYSSSALAMGSASLAMLALGVGGFYLVRGRVGEDLRSGIGAVIGASQVAGSDLLAARWLGGVCYLGLLVLGFCLSMFVCHALRGEGPLQPLVYLDTYVLLLGPMIVFGTGCALLFDSVPALLGKGGDVLWFVLWVVQLSAGIAVVINQDGALSPLMLLDFGGLSVSLAYLQETLHSSSFAIGASPFDAALAPWHLADHVWGWPAYGLRLGAALLALLPMLAAVRLFHRYSPDRVRAGSARTRRSPLAVLNAWLRPLAHLVRPLYWLAARSGGWPGRVLADLALSLSLVPLLIVAAAVAWTGAALGDAAALHGLGIGLTIVWGLAVADVGTRDYAADLEALSGAVPGGPVQRFARQWLSAVLLGLLLFAPLALRWSAAEPARALAVPTGLALLAACAVTLGRCTRTTRSFVGLFLFALYVALNTPHYAPLDALGFDGAATWASDAARAALALPILVAGWWWNRRPLCATR